ncbi:ABC transporter substrate-binding protein [Paenibacillus spongiae]|uniref:ABC transporter substrate-binding protein n=1 Tax=Paenibacillus spongiae TaxID=2909671 RepID=A0ABY5S6W0_9BACL|nr:ABC transporter substrate-binding protein [Paenibacillus spongiae]UVI28458.1 ABC transporter substrate-binding protein [Paenibacillus spongiae]
MKRMNRLGLLVLLLCFMIVNACSNAGSGQGEQKKEDDVELQVSAPGQFPIVNEKVTLKVLVPSNSLVENFETNEFTKWMEEKTNVHVEWEVMPADSAQEKLNLILSSGELPDVIMDSPVTLAQLMVYGNQGMFLPLNDLIDKHGYEIKKVFEKMPIVKETITTPDGYIYALPQVNECYHCTMSQKMWVYKPWLDKLQIDVPQTTEQFYEMLKAFKEKDPNGNGKPDEISLAGAPKTWFGAVDGFLMNPFIYSDKYVANGKIEIPYNKPAFKEGLKYMHKLYAEGLIAPESFTQNGDQLTKLGENPDTPILGAVPGGCMICSFTTRGKDYVTIPALQGPEGKRTSLYMPSPVTRPTEFIITNQAKHPEVALKWADAMFSEEVTFRSTNGIPDKDWRWAKDGEIGINGKPARWTILYKYGNIQNDDWKGTGPSFQDNDFRLSMSVEPGDIEQVLFAETNKNYEPYIPKISEVVPTLFFSEAQSAELAELEKTITNYVDEMKAKFITGKADLEKEWDSYVQTLDKLNVKRYLEIYQEAFDAKK